MLDTLERVVFLPGDTADQCLVNVEFCDANGHRQTRTVSLPDAMALRACLGASQERSTREGMGAGGLSIPASPAGEGGVLFLTLAALSLASGAVADSRGPLPHDGAVDRGCKLARHVRLYRGRESLRRFAEVPGNNLGTRLPREAPCEHERRPPSPDDPLNALWPLTT